MIFAGYIKNNSEQFLAKLRQISALLLTDPEYIMAVMYLESRVNPQAVNANGGATGLIQFMPATAQGLGTSTAELKNMSNVQQLEYVYKYLKPYTGKLKTFADVYSAVFFPAMIGKSNDYVLKTDTLTAYKVAVSNPVFDTNKNQSITAGEFREAVYNILPSKIGEYLKKKVKP